MGGGLRDALVSFMAAILASWQGSLDPSRGPLKAVDGGEKLNHNPKTFKLGNPSCPMPGYENAALTAAVTALKES